VISGNVLGLGLTEIPFMLITFAVADPAVGSRSRKGVDWATVSETPSKEGRGTLFANNSGSSGVLALTSSAAAVRSQSSRPRDGV